MSKGKWEGDLLERFNGWYFAPTRHNGDLLYNTARKIIEEDGRDEWAYNALDQIFDCFHKGKRWPDDMIGIVTTTSHTQADLTQDPIILAFALAIHLDRKQYIENFKPKPFFWFPDKWAWRRALLGKPNFYWLWRIIAKPIPKQWFVKTLYYYMEWAYKRRR